MAKQYLYKISHGDYDISGETELTHTRKIGTREFNNILVEAFLYLLLEKQDKLPSVDGEREGEIHAFYVDEIMEYLNKKKDEYAQGLKERALKDTDGFINSWLKLRYTQPWDVIDNMAFVSILTEKYGFKRLRYEQKVYFGSCLNIVDPERKERDG
ncbi:hypothetical protein LCGC14_1317940 [marine sediment metagenome]|uniref:Uncharacterized protein n=1 Tax=marine sediment metagenome TaxID=412755 RepID=A0A0F9KKW7_9ZZZZ